MFKATLHKIVKLWKQREYPSTDEWIRKKLCIQWNNTVLVNNTTPKDRLTGKQNSAYQWITSGYHNIEVEKCESQAIVYKMSLRIYCTAWGIYLIFCCNCK